MSWLRWLMQTIGRSCVASLAVLVAVFAVACRSNPPEARARRVEARSALDRVTMEQDAVPLGIGRAYSLPAFASIDGVQADAASLMRGKSVVVLAMTSSGCPVSQKYAPRLAAMEREFGPRGVAFVHVNTVAAESDADIREQIKDAGFRGMYAPDRDRALARVLEPRTTAEVYVFDSTWTLRYRGAIDDQFGVGVALQAPRRSFLRDAIEAVLKRGRPKIPATWAPGCLVDPAPSPLSMLGGPTVARDPTTFTYYNRIAHILDRHCLDCHRTNGPGPFNLASATSIEGRAAMIAAVVRDGLMPPSHGDEQSHGAAHWRSPIAMPPQDRADLIAWLSSDRPLGNPSDTPKPNPRPLAWTLGTPDQLLMTDTMRLPADGPLMHQRLTIPTAMSADLWLRAIEMRPMKAGSIERAIAWIVPPGVPAPRAEDDLSEVQGIELLAAYSPGHGSVQYLPRTARRFRAGSTVVVDLYARPMGKPMGVALRIGLYTLAPADGATREVRNAILFASPFEIAPGESMATQHASLALPEDSHILALTPAMGPRGKSVRLAASVPSADPGDLLHLDRFDARWLIRYEGANNLALPRGSTLTLDGVFDNSDTNPSNPTPGLPAKSGPAPTQETLWLSVEYLTPLERAGR